MQPTKILMLPDADIDSRILEMQRQAFPNVIAVDWLAIQPDEPLSDYVQRCIQEWFQGSSPILNIEQPYMLGGIGMGGILALEMALSTSLSAHHPAAVLIVGGCRAWNGLPHWLTRNATLFSTLPRWLTRAPLGLWRANFLRSSDLHNREHAQQLSKMQATVSAETLFNRIRTCASWRRENVDVSRAPFPVHQIHGRLDKRFPAPSPNDATLILDGGHWINLSHHQAVNNWIDAIVRDLELSRRGPKIPLSEKPAS